MKDILGRTLFCVSMISQIYLKMKSLQIKGALHSTLAGRQKTLCSLTSISVKVTSSVIPGKFSISMPIWNKKGMVIKLMEPMKTFTYYCKWKSLKYCKTPIFTSPWHLVHSWGFLIRIIYFFMYKSLTHSNFLYNIPCMRNIGEDFNFVTTWSRKSTGK